MQGVTRIINHNLIKIRTVYTGTESGKMTTICHDDIAWI